MAIFYYFFLWSPALWLLLTYVGPACLVILAFIWGIHLRDRKY